MNESLRPGLLVSQIIVSQVDRRDHWWRWFYDLELLENTVCELDEMIQMLTTVLNWHEHAKERN